MTSIQNKPQLSFCVSITNLKEFKESVSQINMVRRVSSISEYITEMNRNNSFTTILESIESKRSTMCKYVLSYMSLVESTEITCNNFLAHKS